MSGTTAVSIGSSFGWYHHAEGDRGVVMCASIGYEALCAHHSWRVLADRLAAAGLPTLRFDYPGEGDSLGDADGPALLDSWREQIRAAVAWMRETIGVREVTLVGLRLGASLAAEVGGVERLVQLAPIVKGQSYLRELKAMSRILATSGGAPERAMDAAEIALEGFVVTPEIAQQIKAIDLTRLPASPAPRILVMVDPAARGVADYVARAETLGAAVETKSFVDYAALAPAPLPPPPPLADFDAIVAFASEGARRAKTTAPSPGGLATDMFVETAVRFGADNNLVGVLCLPRETPKATVLLLNTGANYHIGCGRSAVVHARALAEMGVASLRMDALGIGESALVPGGPRSVLYRPERAEDVSAALDFLGKRGLTDVTPMGVCSGATLAVFAALRDTRIKGVILGNIQVFGAPDPSTIDALLDASFGSTSTYVSKAMSARAWARVASGEVPLAKLVSIVTALVRRKLTGLARVLSFGSPPGKASEARSNFAALARRGVRVLLMHGDHDVGREEIDACFGAEGRFLRRLPGITLDVVGGVDHSLSSPASRGVVLERLSAFLRSAETSSRVRRKKSKALIGALTLAAIGALALMANFE
jgi:pimeloyl-ACP methyl ester carboxylesterase